MSPDGTTRGTSSSTIGCPRPGKRGAWISVEARHGFCMIFRVDARARGAEGVSHVVETADLQQKILGAYGIVVEPQMAKYVLRCLQQAGGALRELPVIGGNARTGVP